MEQEYVVVVGGINVDICGKPFKSLIAHDSNPGTVRLSPGGVGRNIAHDLRLLALPVKMLTVLGGDLYAQQIEQSCAALGIDLSHALRVPDGATSTYVFITDNTGDMELAVCDAELCERLTPEYLEANLTLLNGAKAVVVETNLPQTAISYLAQHCTAPIFADPVSVTKAEKLKQELGRLHTLKPNRIEAELLSGVRICDEQSLEIAAKTLLATGLRRVFISLGANGLYCAEGDERHRQQCPSTELVNVTGGGDALTAGLVCAYCMGYSLEDSARLALAAGSITVECTQANNPDLNLENAKFKAGITK